MSSAEAQTPEREMLGKEDFSIIHKCFLSHSSKTSHDFVFFCSETVNAGADNDSSNVETVK